MKKPILTRRLEGKTALVTGAPRGLGLGIAQAMAEQGANVAVHFHNRVDEATAAVEDLRARGVDAEAFCGDLSDSSAVGSLFGEVIRRFGGIDIVVANAGASSSHAMVANISDDEFARLSRVNVNATFFVLREAARTIRDGGRIINVSSSSVRNPQSGFGAYATTKAAALATVRVLAQELGARSVTANSLVAGPVAAGFLDPSSPAVQHMGTSMLETLAKAAPAGRLGTPEDIGAVAAFLSGDDAVWVTGQDIVVNGGSSL
jgi:3-oxoacyl-[acyl-carrier protein] reductase